MKITSTCLILSLICAASPAPVFGQDAAPPKSDDLKPAAFYVPPPPPTATEMRALLDGVMLPSGYWREWTQVGPNAEIGGTISGPDQFEINFWLMTPIGRIPAPGQAQFSSYASTLKKGKHKWAREQYISDELVELTLSADNNLAVTYPNRGLNLTCSIKDSSQLAEALVIMLSVTNYERRLSWEDAEKMLGEGGVKSATMLHTGTVFLNMADGSTYTTRQPTDDALFKCLRALGKEDQIPVAVD